MVMRSPCAALDPPLWKNMIPNKLTLSLRLSEALSLSLSLSLSRSAAATGTYAGGSGQVRFEPGPVCVFITAVPIIKLFAWGEGDSGGHVLRETTSRGLCGLVCPSRTSERGGEGDAGEREIV
jgi:hypothetical protein